MVLSRGASSGRAFVAGAAGAVLLVTALFVELFPNVMPSSTSDAFNLTLANASSTHYTLVVMTVVAAVFTPIVPRLPVVDVLGLPPPRRDRRTWHPPTRWTSSANHRDKGEVV